MISPEAPYPLDGGGALRTASLLEYVGRRYQLDLIVFRHAGQEIRRYIPDGLCRNAATIELTQHSKSFPAKVARNMSRLFRRVPPLVDRFSGYDAALARATRGRKYSLAVLEHFWTCSYIPLVREMADKVVLDLHNVESAWHRSCADSAGFPQSTAHRLFAQAAETLEQQWLEEVDYVLTASDEDADRVRRPRVSPVVYPNALPWRDRPQVETDFAIAFSGNLEYEPNRTGIAFFLRDVWPVLRQRFPTLVFRIIGKNPGAIASLVKPSTNVEVTGPVEDVFPHVSRVKVCVAPLLAGSGTRLKIIEAWAAAVPVVSTPLGAEGLGAVDGRELLLASGAEGFAQKVANLLEEEELRQFVAKQGRELYERRFTWKKAWESINTIF